MHVRVCPECEEEYRPDIAVCADCGTELRDHYENDRGEVVGADGQPASEPAVAEEQTVELVTLFAGAASDLKPLAETLASAGVPMQLVPQQGRPTLVLRVAEADAMRAVEMLAPFRDRAEELGLMCYIDWEALPDTGYPACPACEAPLPPVAANCPDCGLELRGAEE